MLKLIFNGVQINNVLPRRRLILYSTTTKSLQQPENTIADYLVDSLGFSREEAVAALKKVSYLKSPEKPRFVIDFFKQIGFKQSQIKIIVSYNARLLAPRDINKTLIPKIRLFQELGFSNSELGSIIASNPSIMQRSIKSHITPSIECLRSILGSDAVVVKAIKRNPMLVNYCVKRLLANASMLRSFGLSGKTLINLVLYNPRHLICQTECLEKNMIDVETILEIPRKSAMFLYGMQVYSSLSRVKIESKFQVFRSYGWSEKDIKAMVRALPICLRLSEAKIRKGLDYFMKELNYEPDYIARFPTLLNFSLENRVLPRREMWKALIEKNLSKVSFCSLVYMPEYRFLNYVMPFKKQLPELDSYINKR